MKVSGRLLFGSLFLSSALAFTACQTSENSDGDSSELAGFAEDFNNNQVTNPTCHNKALQQAGGGLGWRIRYKNYFAQCAAQNGGGGGGNFNNGYYQNSQANPPCHNQAVTYAGGGLGWRIRYSNYYSTCVADQVPPGFDNTYNNNYQTNRPCHTQATYYAGNQSGWRNRYTQFYNQCQTQPPPPNFNNDYNNHYQQNPPCHTQANIYAGGQTGWRNRYIQYYNQCNQEPPPPPPVPDQPNFNGYYNNNYQTNRPCHASACNQAGTNQGWRTRYIQYYNECQQNPN